ncbi:MAG TPA: hypothetical protein VIU35_10255 [Chitinophagaceae bacterium]
MNKFYLQAGAGGGTHEAASYDLGIQTIFKNKWSATLSYHEFEMDPKNLPSDYEPETMIILFIPITHTVQANMKMVSLTAGRYFKMGRNTWATTEAGLSYVSGEKVSFQHSEVTSSFFLIAASNSSNYTTTKEKKSTVGFMMQTDVNWAFSSFMGLGAGVFANINSIQSPIGFHVKLLVGNMGREKKNRK